jgi:hypothetical protein
MIALLVLWADSWDVDCFLRGYPALKVGRRWRAGEPRRPTGTMRHSGLHLELAESEDWGQLISTALGELDRLREVVAAARGLSANAVLDFAVSVGEEDHFTRTVTFTLPQLRELVAAGVEISLTAYPTSSDEENAP